MKELSKYIILLFSIIISMLAASLIVSPVSIFDLPTHLDQYIDIKSYYCQGLCASLVGVIVSHYIAVSKYSVFSLCALWGVVIFTAQSARVGECDLYYALHSVLPFLAGVATLIFMVGILKARQKAPGRTAYAVASTARMRGAIRLNRVINKYD